MIVELWSTMQSALWNLDEKWCESTEDSHFLRKFHHSWPEAMVYSLKCLKCWYFFHTLILHQKTMTHQLGLYRLLSSLFCMVFKAFWETHIAVYKSKLSKKLHLCSADKRKSYTSGMARGGVFGWNILLIWETFWLIKSCPNNSVEMFRWNVYKELTKNLFTYKWEITKIVIV